MLHTPKLEHPTLPVDRQTDGQVDRRCSQPAGACGDGSLGSHRVTRGTDLGRTLLSIERRAHMRVLSIEHGLVDDSSIARRLDMVANTMGDLLDDGKIKDLKKTLGRDTTVYTVVADDVEEDEIVGGLAEVVRAQNPSWTVTVLDQEGRTLT
jgi:hypothetical protein